MLPRVRTLAGNDDATRYAQALRRLRRLPVHGEACHTPKNLLGGDKTTHPLHGGLLQDWYAPPLDSDPRTGLGSWSVEDIVQYLKTGHNRSTATSGTMLEIVENATSQLAMQHLQAMAIYLKDQPPSSDAGPTGVQPDEQKLRVGAAIYRDECAACHTNLGEGVPGLIPRLAGSPAVQADKPVNLIYLILHGGRSAATDAAPVVSSMPQLGWKLNDDQVAAVTSYIRNAWGNAAPAVDASAVRAVRSRSASSR